MLYRPHTLWFETLPDGDTARVYLSPHEDGVSVIGHVNGELCRYECCASLAEARLRGWEWWEELFDSPTPPQPERVESEPQEAYYPNWHLLRPFH